MFQDTKFQNSVSAKTEYAIYHHAEFLHTVVKEYPDWLDVRFGDIVCLNNGGSREYPGYSEVHEMVHSRGNDLVVNGDTLFSYQNEGWELMKIIRSFDRVREEDFSNGFAE